MLRNEAGIYYEDLYPLVALLPRYACESNGTDTNDLLPLWQASRRDQKVPQLYPLRPSRLPPDTGFFHYFPILRPIKRIPKMFKPKEAEAHEEPIDSNVPLQIILHISSYNAYLLRNELVPSAAGSMLTNNITGLHDAISNLQRIKSTPLPFAYQAHMRMTLWCEAPCLSFPCKRAQSKPLL